MWVSISFFSLKCQFAYNGWIYPFRVSSHFSHWCCKEKQEIRIFFGCVFLSHWNSNGKKQWVIISFWMDEYHLVLNVISMRKKGWRSRSFLWMSIFFRIGISMKKSGWVYFLLDMYNILLIGISMRTPMDAYTFFVNDHISFFHCCSKCKRHVDEYILLWMSISFSIGISMRKKQWLSMSILFCGWEYLLPHWHYN